MKFGKTASRLVYLYSCSQTDVTEKASGRLSGSEEAQNDNLKKIAMFCSERSGL